MKSLRDFIIESLKPIFNCWIMVGIAGAGKSTWIKNNLPKGIKIVNQDQIRVDMGIMTNIDKKAIGSELEEQEVRKKNDQLINKYINSKTDFVIDNVNASYGRILNLYQRLKSIGANVKIVIVDTDVETCLSRRKEDIPEKIIRQMSMGIKKIKREFKNNKDCIIV